VVGTQSVSDKYTEVVNNHERDADEDQLIWKTTLSGDMEQQLDDKERALQSIKRLVTKRLRKSELDDEVWLTTREIANEMDISIYSMRYLLCQMETNGKVISIKTGRSHTFAGSWPANSGVATGR
jgi:hypothetical protein